MPVPRRTRFSKAFFDRHHLTVAQDLLGCELRWDGVGGIVVETEAYAASDDPACHVFFRPSVHNFFRTHPPGTVYVYMNYGVHWLLNVLTRDGIVLFRALEPTRGVEQMQQRRQKESLTALCSGPGKLGQALQLGPADHATTLLTPARCVLPPRVPLTPQQVLTDVRVGITKAADRPWRFLVMGNPHVSVAHGKAARRVPVRKRPPLPPSS